jgi:hypothetical protein
MRKGGMPTLPTNQAVQQKATQNPKAPKPGQKMENGLDIEMRFVENYKKHKNGSEPYAQYANVKMPDGSTKRVLAYDLGDGKNYIPQLHGPDFPFQSIDTLNKIPSVMDVVEGRFNPQRNEEPAQGSASGVFANKLTTNYMEPKDPILAGFTPQVSAEVAATPVQPGSTPQPAPAPKSAQDQLNEALLGRKVNPKYADAAKLREQAASIENKVLRPGVTLESALPLILGTIFAGEQGASVLKGGVQGIEQATAMRQAESDIQTAAARNKLLAQAQGIDKTASEEDQVRDSNITGLANMANQENRVELQTLRNDVAKQRIQATLRGQDMTQINKLAGLGPQGRIAFAKQMQMSDEDAIALSQMTPAELQKMASVDLTKEKTTTEKELRQPKIDRLRAATTLDQALVELTGLRKEGQAARNALDLKEFQWFDANMRSKIGLIEAQTDKAAADAQKAERELFYNDGSPKPFDSRGMTDTAFTTNWSKFQAAMDKADSEIVEKRSLVAKMRDSVAKLETEAKASAAKDPILGADPAIAKKIQKLRDSIDITESEIEGLNVTMSRNRSNIETLGKMKAATGAPGTGQAQGKRTPQQQLEAYNRNKDRMSPQDRARVEAALRQQGIIR